MMRSRPKLVQLIFLVATLKCTSTYQDFGYLTRLKENCLTKGEALSCLKYKAVKEITKSFLGDEKTSNFTVKSYDVITLVPLGPNEVNVTLPYEDIVLANNRGFFSEWSQLTMYWVKVLTDFFSQKGLRIELPEGSRTFETDIEDSNPNGESRGKKKKLAIILPLLSLLAAVKAKLLLIPILLAVLFIKKLLLAAALLIPSLLSTLKACKAHHHHAFQFGLGSNDPPSAEVASGYGSGYSYSGSKDWAANRAYQMQNPRYPA